MFANPFSFGFAMQNFRDVPDTGYIFDLSYVKKFGASLKTLILFRFYKK